jgi:hypothetical protein
MSKNKNMTAVEWLFDKITQNQDIRWRGTQYEDLFEQAKAMHKEQIIKAFTSAYLIGEDNITQEDARNEAEQYYLETYEQ